MDQLPVPIYTNRLIIRDPVRTDMRFWSTLNRNKKVRIYLNGPLTRSASNLWTCQQGLQKSAARPLIIANKDSGELIGVCGFFQKQENEWEIWVVLQPKNWGQAFGTEITTSLIDVAFTCLFANQIVAIIHPENSASIRMIKKLDFVFVGDYHNESSWQHGHKIYCLNRNMVNLKS